MLAAVRVPPSVTVRSGEHWKNLHTNLPRVVVSVADDTVLVRHNADEPPHRWALDTFLRHWVQA